MYQLVDFGLLGLTSLAYIASSVLFGAYLARSDSPRELGVLAARFVGLGALLHAAHIIVASYALRVCPVHGFHFSLSVAAAVTGGIYAAMRTRYNIDALGVLVAPLALTFLLASRFAPTDPPASLKSAILPFHVASNMVGVSLFTLAFATAVAYLVQESQLKAKRVGGMFRRLPALDTLDRAEHRFLAAGFPLLTIGIITGTLWARGVELGDTRELARASFGYISWALFALVLLLRTFGWRGRRAAYGTILGFGFTVLILLFYLVRQSPGGTTVALP